MIGRLEQALWQINPGIDTALLNEALRVVQRPHSLDLLANNEAFHRLLTEGVPVTS